MSDTLEVITYSDGTVTVWSESEGFFTDVVFSSGSKEEAELRLSALGYRFFSVCGGDTEYWRRVSWSTRRKS